MNDAKSTAQALTMRIDPVCGMNVEPDRAAPTEVWRGITYYFCCKGCSAKFNADPDAYLSAKGRQTSNTPDHEEGGVYTCPMDPEVRQDHPGACPKCGMALEREMNLQVTRTQYTCPMHPGIIRDEPGDCPICGMALEPVVVALEEEENPELIDMTRRFWASAALSVPLVIIAMGEVIPGVSFDWLASPPLSGLD